MYSRSIGHRTCVHYSCRIVRTQATKTLEIYLQKIKALTASYPDTALPPSTNSSEIAPVPHMATANTDDSSWAGWAISSFTKKLNTASGEIERGPTPNKSNDARPPFIPAISASRPTPLAPPEVTSASHLAKQEVTPLLLQFPREGGEDNEDNDPDGWGDLEEENFFDAPVEPSNPKTSIAAITDTRKGKGDHGIVSNMSSVFERSKSPLPKGLAKMSSTVAAARNTPRTGFGLSFPNTRENVVAPAKAAGTSRPIGAGKIETKMLQDPWDTGDEDWGDSWDK